MVRSTTDSTILDTPLGDLVFRIRGTSRHGQMVRLKSAKCTIGSSPNCTLRLHGKGINPVHCLILRGPNGAVIRRWSPNTLLNGQTFTNALILPGDRLSIGTLEFEIVATAEQLEQDTAAVRAEENKLEAGRPLWKALCSAQLRAGYEKKNVVQSEQIAEFRTPHSELEEERKSWTSQQEKWQAERTASQQQLEERIGHYNQLVAELDARTAELENRQSQLNALAAELKARQDQLDAQASTLEIQNQELDNKTVRLAEQSTDIQGRSSELDARYARLDAQSAELKIPQSQLDKQGAALEMQGKELNAQAAEWADQSAKIHALTSELDARSAQLDARSAELETHQSQ